MSLADFLFDASKELPHPVDSSFKFRWLYCFYLQDNKSRKLKIGHSCNPKSRNRKQTNPKDVLYFPLGFMTQTEAYRKEQEVFEQIREFVVQVPTLKYSKTPTHDVNLDFKHDYAFSGASETFIVPNQLDFDKIFHVIAQVSFQSMQETGGEINDLCNLIEG